MKRSFAFVLLAAAVAAGTAGEAGAQETMASRFDIGVYAGGAYTTSWFESRNVTVANGVFTEDEEGQDYRIGLAPVFGANATYWATPGFGVRVHYGYMPSDLPEPEDDAFDGGVDDGIADGDDGDYPLNNHFVDLDLVFRLPGLPVLSMLSSNLYGWVGGGALITNLAGEADAARGFCQPRLLRAGACLSYDPEFATVGQGVVGIGGDLVSLSGNVGIFAELAAHIYDSPVHVGDAFVPAVRVPTGGTTRVADDRYAVTPRLVLGLKAAFGSFGEPLPPPAPAPVPVPAPLPPAPPVEEAIRVCVVEGTALTEVEAIYLPATGDTVVMVQGERRPFAAAYPAVAPPYAAGEPWFVNNEPIMVMDRRYVKYGLPRVIGTGEVMRVGEYQGIGVFAEVGAPTPPEVIYVPVRTGCEFQPYRYEVPARGVRG